VKSATIFVGQLPRDCLDEEFSVAFMEFDPLSCTIKRNDDGQSRGFGFVQFETAEQAEVALAKNGEIVVRDKVVSMEGRHGTSSYVGNGLELQKEVQKSDWASTDNRYSTAATADGSYGSWKEGDGSYGSWKEGDGSYFDPKRDGSYGSWKEGGASGGQHRQGPYETTYSI
jgi:RNA recognition motif-containing protein